MSLSHIKTWVFDLDNTLYPRTIRLFDQIEVLMERFITRELSVGVDEARRLRDGYWESHGTTMSGLVDLHGIDPDHFLREVHDIDIGHVEACDLLSDALRALPGRKIIYTNGSRAHGERVATARGIRDAFDAVYGIEDAGYRAKPSREAFERIFETDGLDPRTSAMVEDDPRNLRVPAELGMVTVLVGDHMADHIHHRTDDLAAFLRQSVSLPGAVPFARK